MRLILVLLLSLLTTSATYSRQMTHGVSSILSPGESYALYEEFTEYISRKLGTPMDTIHKGNYAEMNRLIESGNVDIASICTGALLHLPEGSFRVLAVPVVDGRAGYRSYIITNAKSNVRTFTDLKGRLFAMTDRLSNTGYLYPTWLVTKKGQKPEQYFGKVSYTGSHDKSITLVSKGVVDGAAVDSIVFNASVRLNKELGKTVRVVEQSPEFVSPPIVASERVNAEEFRKTRQVLLSMHKDPEGKRILGKMGIEQFAVPDAEAFALVRSMKRFVDENAKK